MERNIENLLQPTLTSKEQKVPIFSVRACFFTAFLGGPMAVVLLSALNSNRLKRIKKDLIFYLMGISIYLVYMIVILNVPEGTDVSEWVAAQRRENIFYRYGSRGLGLLFWAAYYYLHKQYYKTMSLFDIEPPNPWVSAIICILAGGLLQVLVALIVIRIGGVSL